MPVLNTACGPCYQNAMNWRTTVENSNKIVLEDCSILGETASEALTNTTRKLDELEPIPKQNRIVSGYHNLYTIPIDEEGNLDTANVTVVPVPEEGEIALETLSPKERFEFFLCNTGSDELIKAFADYINERAIELMIRDNKVEGKHYAAMKLIMNEYGIEHNLT